MEKEELKRRLVKLKKDLAEKKRKLKKCERLSKARCHVQQKIREQAYMMENDCVLSNGFSGHIPTKVTFEKCSKDDAGLWSDQDQRRKLSDSEQRPVSVICKYELPATEESSTGCSPSATAKLPVRNYCFNKDSERSTLSNNSSINPQQIDLVVHKNDNESASSDFLNSTYTVTSRGNWINGQAVVTDDSCTTADSQDSYRSDSDLNQKIHQTNRSHQTCKEKQKSLLSCVSKNRSVVAKSDSSCEYHRLYQHSCDDITESFDLQDSPRHLSEGCLLGSLSNHESCNDTKTPNGLFPNAEICNDTKVPLLAGDSQTGKNETKRCTEQHPVSETYENKKGIDPAVRKSNLTSDWLLVNEPDSSENFQDVAFIVDPDSHSTDTGQWQDDQSGNLCSDTELSRLDTEDKNSLTIEENKENVNLLRHPGDKNPDKVNVNKQNNSLKSHRRYSEADLLDVSFCEWDEDMYSQVKSRKNRRERLLSVPCEKLVLSQPEMVSTLLSQNGEDTKCNCGNKTRKNKSKTAHREKRAASNKYGQHLKRKSWKSDTGLINDAFLKMLPEIEPHVLEFVLPENDFGDLLAEKLNSYKTLICECSQSAAKMQENQELDSLDCAHDYVQHVMDEDSKDSQELLGYDSNEMDTNGGSSILSQDSSILSSDTTKEFFSYHSSIKLENSDPIMSLWCDVNEKFKPHEVTVACTPFRVMVWLRRGCGWRLTNVWTLEQLEAECILSCHISTCHRWVFIWTTVQCSTRLTAACIESNNKLFKILWTTKLLFTHSQKHYSFKLNTAEFIIGSVTPADQTQLVKVMLNECNGTLVVNVDVKSIELDAAQEQLLSVVPIEGLPEALLGTTSTMFYIWNHVSGRLVHRVAIGHELISCPVVYHYQGILLMAVITKSNMMGCLLAVNPTTNRTSILCMLETTPKDTHLKLSNLQSNGKLLCGQRNDNSLWLWYAHSGKLISYSCKRLSRVSAHLCQERLLIVIKNTIHVYCFKT